MDSREQLRRLEAQLAELKARMPAHTMRPAMLMEMEDLEEEIDRLRGEVEREGDGDAEGAA